MEMKRTIDYFYRLDGEKAAQVMKDIVAIGEVAPDTAYKYMRGERKPLPLYQNLIKRLIRKYYNVDVPRKELFA